MIKALAVSAVAFLLAGCGSPNGNSWLIRTATDEVSVKEAGIRWIEMAPEARIRFLSGNNPVGDFVTALGRNSMVTEEIDNETYLYSPVVQTMRDCWLTNSSFIAYTDSITSQVRENISEGDLSNYRELLGKIVWYSSETEGQQGPERLPELGWAVAFAFDSMDTGSTVEIEGLVYTLDSVVTSPRHLIDETLADTDRFVAFAINSLAESRVKRHLASLKNTVLESINIDSAAVATYCTRRGSMEDSAILASWNSGSISVLEFDGITTFLSIGRPYTTTSASWVSHNLNNQARLSYITEIYAEENPDDFITIQQEANDFAVDKASELLYTANVTNMVVVPDSMVLEAYSVMDSIPMMPESRIFESVAVSGDVLDEALAMVNNGDDLLEFGNPGYREFLAPGTEFLSRQVYPTELPQSMETTLFLLEEGDSQWQRPIEVVEDLFVIYRLVEIIPPHTASFEEMYESIKLGLLVHLEEQRTMEWICELEQNYDLQINHEILGDLPEDPSLWGSL
ncbi:MAG: peptidyl-prolyl cis-trans isomerase [Candidatus Sabulitectum sp.]|nr:peptidyl-prolyl cis-trans isomerase [Candidatus Sabulitectum sp.]